MSFFQDLFEGLTADYALKPEDFERASQASTRRPSSTDEENQGGDGGGNGSAGEEDGASIFDSVLSGATGMVSSLLAGDFEWTHEKETKKEEAYFEEPGPSPLDDEEHCKPARKRDFTMVSGSQFEAVMRIEKECYDRDATVSEEAEDEQLVEPPSAAGQTSAAEDAPGKTPKSSAPTLESHLEQFFWRFPEYRADVRQLGDGAYSVSGRRVGLQINERNQVEVRDGPMRQVLEDYIGGNLTTAVYANSHLQPGAVSSTSTSTAAPYVADADSQRKVSFDDQDQVYNRIEAMRVAKEQAKARLLSATSAVGGGAASERESFERYRRWHQVALQKEAPIDAYGNKIDIDTGRVSAYGGYWGGGASWFGGTGDSSGRAGEYYAGEGGANRITAENRQGTEVLTAPVLLGGGIGMGGPMGSYTNL
eukprot:g12163.t1